MLEQVLVGEALPDCPKAIQASSDSAASAIQREAISAISGAAIQVLVRTSSAKLWASGSDGTR